MSRPPRLTRVTISATAAAAGPAAVGDQQDGRLLRGARTRRAIVQAYTDLLSAGHGSPRAQQVAELAGVGIRTVYNQFSDLEALRAEAGVEVWARIAPYHLTADDVPADAGLERRLELYVRRRVRVLEILDPYARGAQGRHPSSPALTAHRQMLVDASLAELALVFAPELDRLPAAGRSQLLSSLHMVSCWPSWASLLDELGLSRVEARATVLDTLRRLLSST